MKKLPVIITILILASCSTSSDVVQNGRINKRKYNDGIFHHKKNRSLFNKRSYPITSNDFKNKKRQSENIHTTNNGVAKNISSPSTFNSPLVASNNTTSPEIIIEHKEQDYYMASESASIDNSATRKVPFIIDPLNENSKKFTDDDDKEIKEKPWKNFIINMIVPGLGTFLSGQKLLGILQFLLFLGGIYGAYWLFWNTSVHLIYPILISILSMFWSGYSTYPNQPNVNEIIQTEQPTIEYKKEVKSPIKNFINTINNYKAYRKATKKLDDITEERIVGKKSKSLGYLKSPEYKKGTRKLIRGLISSMILGLLWLLFGLVCLTYYVLIGMAASSGYATSNEELNKVVLTALGIGALLTWLTVTLGIIPIARGEKLQRKAKKTFENAENEK